MIILFVVIVIAVIVAVGLCVEMSRRDDALLGLVAITVLMVAGVLGAVYAALAAD